MKDHKGRIHLFEVKSLNQSSLLSIDSEEYKQKVRVLKDCYLAYSRKLPDYYFYLPIRKYDCWQITRLHNGQEDYIDQTAFLASLQQSLHYRIEHTKESACKHDVFVLAGGTLSKYQATNYPN